MSPAGGKLLAAPDGAAPDGAAPDGAAVLLDPLGVQAARAALPPIRPAAARKLRRGTRVLAIRAISSSRPSFATYVLLLCDAVDRAA